MATPPTPQPSPEQGGAPGGAQPGVAPAQQQANPLQTMLAQIAKGLEQLSQQNPIVQAELMEARTALVKALQKTMTASRPQESQPAPQQGPSGQ